MTLPEPSAYLDATTRLAAAATALAALESLAIPTPAAALLDASSPSVPGPRLARALLVAEAVACLALVLGAGARSLALVVLAARLAGARRRRFGIDGAVQMATLTWSALSLAALWPEPRVEAAALGFIGAQALLAYVTAGLVKLGAPAWRDGSAVLRVLRTSTYGRPALASLLAPRRRLSAAITRAVVAFELSVPFGVVLGPRARLGWLSAAAIFHVVTGHVMGLGGFPLAFLAAWPAVIYAGTWIAQAPS